MKDHSKRPIMTKVVYEMSDVVIPTADNPRDENIENIALCLSNISGKVRPNKTASRTRDNHLEDLAKRYTMNSERETHLGSSKPTPTNDLPAETLPAGTSPGKEDDLGDNVDLF